jgi:hypothetical protein
MPAYTFLVGPWAWRRGCWVPPKGTLGGLDLGKSADFAKPGQPRPVGLFALPAWKRTPAGYAVLRCRGDAREAKPGARDRNLLWSELGLTTPLAGDTLADLVWDILTRHADPEGEQAVGPLVPGRGTLELHLPGHGRVRSEPFTWGRHPHTNCLRDRLRRDFRRLRKHYPETVIRKALGAVTLEHGIRDWQEIDPDGLGPLHPSTSISESFDQGSLPTVGPDLTWAVTAGSWETLDDAIRVDNDDPTAAWQAIRAESVLSGQNQVATLDVGYYTNGAVVDIGIGPAVRFGAGTTLYTYVVRDNAGTQGTGLYKLVGGVATLLDSSAATWASADTIRCSAIGSTIGGAVAGNGVLSVTDTSITANLKAGIAGFGRDPSQEVRGDNFTAEDEEGSTATVQPWGIAASGPSLADIPDSVATMRPNGVRATGPTGTASGSHSVSTFPQGAFASGPQLAGVDSFTISDSVTARPNGIYASGPAASAASVTDADVAVQPWGILASGPESTVTDSVATVRPLAAYASGARLSVLAVVTIINRPQGARASGPAFTLVVDHAVNVRPQGTLAAGPRTGTLVLSPSVSVHALGIYTAGHSLTPAADAAASVVTLGSLASGPGLTASGNATLAIRPQGTGAGAPTLAATLTVSLTHRPQGTFGGAAALTLSAGSGVAARPDGVTASGAPVAASAAASAVVHTLGTLATAPRTGTLTADAAASVHTLGTFGSAPSFTVSANASATVAPSGTLAASPTLGALTATIVVTCRPQAAYATSAYFIGGISITREVIIHTQGVYATASGPQAGVSGGHGVAAGPSGGAALASAPTLSAGASAAVTVQPGGTFGGGPLLTVTVPASVSVRASGVLASGPRTATVTFSGAATLAPGFTYASGPQARPYARAGNLYWIPVEGSTPVLVATAHIDQEPPP